MTGYGRGQKLINGRDITVEVKSVNHKYFEFNCRLPRAYGYLEEKLKAFFQQSISRGKVDCFVTINAVGVSESDVTLDVALASGYINALRSAADELSLKDDLTLSTLLRFSDIFTVTKAAVDEEQLWLDVMEVASEAAANFVKMRELEGEKLKADVLMRGEKILELVSLVEARSPEIVTAYRKRLTDKITEVLEDRNIDEARIVTEAAIFADRIAVDEETVRLRSHVAQLGNILSSDGPVGRKLDFLLQEMNREANTTGSKNSDLYITNTVVDIKSELEKIREQIQNIE